MKYIKQIQGLTQSTQETNTNKPVSDKFRNIPPRVTSQFNAQVTKSKHRMSQPSLDDRFNNTKAAKPAPGKTNKMSDKQKPKLEIKQLREFGEISRKEDVSEVMFNEKDKITNRGIQTERSEDVNKLYECGVIKYPSPSVMDQINHTKRKNSIRLNQDHGDTERSPNVEEKITALSESFFFMFNCIFH